MQTLAHPDQTVSTGEPLTQAARTGAERIALILREYSPLDLAAAAPDSRPRQALINEFALFLAAASNTALPQQVQAQTRQMIEHICASGPSCARHFALFATVTPGYALTDAFGAALRRAQPSLGHERANAALAGFSRFPCPPALTSRPAAPAPADAEGLELLARARAAAETIRRDASLTPARPRP